MTANIVQILEQRVEQFLGNWTQGMDRAGYLKYTTARKSDCIESYLYFLEPILKYVRDNQALPLFSTLLLNHQDIADNLIAVSRRHRSRGVSAEMFIGCFKTLIQAIEEIIMGMEASHKEKLAGINMIRRFSDVYETLIVGDWLEMTEREAHELLAKKNRALTLEKNKYENIVEAIPDVVLVTDADGKIKEANDAAYRYMGFGNLSGKHFWEALNLEGQDVDEVTRYYAVNTYHEIQLYEQGPFFHLQIIPMKSVSLASKGFMIVLSDVSCPVLQRESLEMTVNERTLALMNKEKQFASLFQAAGEGILLVDTEFNIVEANRHAAQMFGIKPNEMRGLLCNALCSANSEMNFQTAIRNLGEDEIWEGEMIGQTEDGSAFPMAVTINCIDLETRTLFHILVKDITNQKKLEEDLRLERDRVNEMNITLRNVIKSIDEELESFQKRIAKNVQNLLLPVLEKARNEPDKRVQDGYFTIIKDQLIRLAAGKEGEAQAIIFKLTRTEKKICQFIQAGCSTKEIADFMCLSTDTVQTHRKNIRKKLGLQGKNISLFSFLNAPEGTVKNFV
ncbi:MAG TPA: PAS domain S-box protein [Candidatus Aminicenantes bacterium]|nr:PAS domain S-box protein [Candidatus Aminicenantes bacterium]